VTTLQELVNALPVGNMRTAMAGDSDFRRFGPYVLLRTSGAGGMGRVELALRGLPDGTAKLCVLKRMHADFRTRDNETRFRREATIALQLSHDAIAQSVALEEIDRELVLLQELVHGIDLRLLETRAATAGELVPLPIALHIVSEVARALAHAHAFDDLAIVHRDVTPDNVMLAFSGEVKLVDFGIARSNADAMLTRTGHIVGRPTYTAPEVWEGEQADRRADLYSLGVVLWQLLSGRRFDEADELQDQSPWPADLPAGLSDVVAQALRPNPDDRYQDANALRDDLRRFLPADFDAKAALAELIARYFDVARERQMLGDDVARARRLLTPVPAARPLVPGRRRSPEAATWVAAGVAAAVVAVGLASGLALWPRSNGAASQEPARPDPPAPAPASTREEASGRPAARVVVARAPNVAGEPNAPRHGEPDARLPAEGRLNTMRSLASNPTPPSTDEPQDQLSEELLRRARDKFDVGETDAALAMARQAVRAGARARAHVLMGEVMMSERRFDEAEREFAEAVRLDPGDQRAAQLLGLVRENRRSAP
jgi:eukaryotic-like serine/threonine-protein kinase